MLSCARPEAIDKDAQVGPSRLPTPPPPNSLRVICTTTTTEATETDDDDAELEYVHPNELDEFYSQS